MNKTKIEWCDFTWNPITGCKRGCDYCYARRIHERFNKRPFSEIVFHPERLNDPMKIKKPSVVFVGSMSDVEYWPGIQFRHILDVCTDLERHTFMFLSKSCTAYSEITEWPKNVMQGLTLESLGFGDVGALDVMALYPRPYVSLEPLIGPVEIGVPDKIEKVIIGLMTGPGYLRPDFDFLDLTISNIKALIPEEKLFWKNTIKERAVLHQPTNGITGNTASVLPQTAENINCEVSAAS